MKTINENDTPSLRHTMRGRDKNSLSDSNQQNKVGTISTRLHSGPLYPQLKLQAHLIAYKGILHRFGFTRHSNWAPVSTKTQDILSWHNPRVRLSQKQQYGRLIELSVIPSQGPFSELIILPLSP